LVQNRKWKGQGKRMERKKKRKRNESKASDFSSSTVQAMCMRERRGLRENSNPRR